MELGLLRLYTEYANHIIGDEKNSRILINKTLMNSPTKDDRNIYQNCLFAPAYNCGFSKKAAEDTCLKQIL